MERRVTLKRTKEEPGPSSETAESENLNLNSAPVVSPALEVNVNTIKKRRASGGSVSRRKLRTISAGSDRTKRSVSNSESNGKNYFSLKKNFNVFFRYGTKT